MKMMKVMLIASLVLIPLLTTSCRRNTNAVWEDTKTAGRHVSRGFRSLGGKHTDSRLVNSRDEFMPIEDGEPVMMPPTAWQEQEFVPLRDDPNAQNMQMINRPARENPGEPGSSVPGISAFKDPSSNPQWAAFQNIHFAYNTYLVKGENNLEIIRAVSDYMRQNPNVYVFVEGHCDERGPESYNYALGANRANSVRNMLISEGVNPDNIFTISYGKDRPIVAGNDEMSWGQNRRAEFKVYER